MFSIIGLILSLVLIMFLAYKGYSTIITAPIVALLTLIVTTGFDSHLMASYTEVYMSGFSNFVKNYFKVVNDCGKNKTPCFASEYRKLAGNVISTWNPKAHYNLASGVSLGVGEVMLGDTLFRVYVDVNGQKGPNIFGRDIFIMYIYKNGLLDDSTLGSTSTAPMTETDRTNMFNSNCNTSSTAIHGCFGKILNDNWEMNY